MGGKMRRAIQEYQKIIFGKTSFIVALMLLGIGMPVAPFLVGFSQFLLLFLWIMEGRFLSKWNDIKSNKALHAFLLFTLVHVLWLINTTNFDYALHDIKIKLPLLLLPILVVSGHSISTYNLKHILLIFVATVIVGTFISTAVYLGVSKKDITDIRDISIFISHIRFGLMIVFSVFVLIYYLYKSFNNIGWFYRAVYVFAIIWLLLFLLILQSVTSWVVIVILTYVLILFYYKKIKRSVLKTFSWVYVFSVPIVAVGLLVYVLAEFYQHDKIDIESLPKTTQLGNPYTHNLNSDFTENGHFVWLNYAGKELREYWPNYSSIPFNGSDAKGQPIKHTLVRYLTSLNLPKDAEGLGKLSQEDIEMIENGYASCIYKSKFTPYVKLYELVWELNAYYKSGNPNAKTISMRIEYVKTGIRIFKDNFLFGVGTGDVQHSFDEYYEKHNSRLEDQNRRRAHNQYLTFALTFGLVGFIIVFYSFIKPILINKQNWIGLSLVFVVIVAISMINEDMMETQSGATFFAYFYSILILRKSNND